MAYTHTLPTEAQITGGDTVQFGQRTRRDDQLEIELIYGTETDGEFTAKTTADGREDTATLRIGDMEGFRSANFDGNAPGAKGDPMDQADRAIAEYADAQGLWPTQ